MTCASVAGQQIHFADEEAIQWRWLRLAAGAGGGGSPRQAPQPQELPAAGPCYTPVEADVGCKLRIECTPALRAEDGSVSAAHAGPPAPHRRPLACQSRAQLLLSSRSTLHASPALPMACRTQRVQRGAAPRRPATAAVGLAGGLLAAQGGSWGGLRCLSECGVWGRGAGAHRRGGGGDSGAGAGRARARHPHRAPPRADAGPRSGNGRLPHHHVQPAGGPVRQFRKGADAAVLLLPHQVRAATHPAIRVLLLVPCGEGPRRRRVGFDPRSGILVLVRGRRVAVS